MDILLNAIILAVVLGLLVNLIFKWLPPDKPTAVVAAAVLIIICVLLALNQIRQQKEKPCTPEPCPKPPSTSDRSYEIVEHGKAELPDQISKATDRIYATGIVISSIEDEELEKLVQRVRRNPNLKVKLIMLKPDGESLKLRAAEEGSYAPNRVTIARKFITLRNLVDNSSLSQEEKDRIEVKYVDVYPTISVTIIDKDLYAYFYPFNARGVKSPVVIFKDFESKEDKAAKFFEMHFNNIKGEAHKPTDKEYAEYEKILSLAN